MTSNSLKIGILADTSFQLSALANVVQNAGYNVIVPVLANADKLKTLPIVDAWVVRLDLQNELALHFVEILDGLSVPIIYDDYEDSKVFDDTERSKRFSVKINMCIGQNACSPLKQSRAKEVWILAASAGGPEAVIEFIKALPEKISDVAFFYVQHIDTAITATLQKAIIRNTYMQVFTTEKAHFVSGGCLYVISPGHSVELSKSGLLSPVSEPWSGDYKPSINQVMAKVARVYGNKAGAIIFSGMGDDGANSCRYLKHYGGLIWAQTPESCTIDSMPLSALKTGQVTFQGTPSELARQFVAVHNTFRGGSIASLQQTATREVKV